MELKDLKKILMESWNLETCSPGLKQEWDISNPSIGQCAITALVVNDLFGGKIMRCMSSTGSHYYNLLDNRIIDLTVEQFNGEIPLYIDGSERSREYLLSNEDTKKRYFLLLNNLKDKINYIKLNKLIGKDGKEYYSEFPATLDGNKKSKIYGRLNCPSTKRFGQNSYYPNRVFFENEEMAIEAGYRPCAICMREKYNEWKRLKLKLDL